MKFMRLISFIMILTLFLAYSASLTITPLPGKVEAAGPQKGPRAPGLEIKFLPDIATMYTALVAGDLEYMGMLTPGQFEDAKTRPEITTYLEATYNVQDEAMQCNYTMPTYPEWRSPTNDVNFREAICHLVDRDWIVESVYNGFAERIDVPIAAPSRGWMNTSLIGPNYPYPYSPASAIQRLEDPAVYGSAENGWYDYDDDDIRNYPLDWDGVEGETGVRDEPNIHPLHYWIYDDPPERYEYAHALAEELRAIGIPVNEHVAPFCVINDVCWCAYNYHISSDEWSVRRFPTYLFPTYLYWWFHSSNWKPGYCGLNAYTGDNEPWTAEIDAAVRAIVYAKTVAEAEQACLHAQYLLVDKYCVGMIPIRSSKRVYASRNLLGAAKFYGGSPFNWASEMNAYRADDPTKPIRVTTEAPPNLNTIYCMWTSGYFVMQRTWEPLMVLNPADPMYEMPAAAQDWETSTWSDGEEEKTLTKWWFSPDVNYVQPVTGDVLDPFNNSMQVFSTWYMYQTPDAWWHADYADIHHIRIDYENPYYMEYYWDTISCFYYLDAPGSTQLGMYPPVYKQYPIVEDPDNLGTAGPAVRTYVEGVNLTTPGDLKLPWQTEHAPVEIVSIVEEGVGALKPADVHGDWDYEIVLGKIHIYKDITDGTSITVTYWAKGPSDRYVTVGKIPWDEIFTGCGPWVMTRLDMLTGVTFKANRNHHWTTPPLGETDWYWWREEGPKPRGGYMKINIYDVVIATSIYGTQGRYAPDAAFTPTADLSESADGLPGKIDIYDVVTIASQYGTGFWNTSAP